MVNITFEKIKNYCLTLTAFFISVRTVSSFSICGGNGYPKLEAQLSSELQKVNTKYQEIEKFKPTN